MEVGEWQARLEQTFSSGGIIGARLLGVSESRSIGAPACGTGRRIRGARTAEGGCPTWTGACVPTFRGHALHFYRLPLGVEFAIIAL